MFQWHNKGINISIEDAIRTLERLKVVHIVVGIDEEIQIYNKLSGLDSETRMLIESFNMADNVKFQNVGMWRIVYIVLNLHYG